MASDPFKRLLTIIDTLMGPNGCPWDRKQTTTSLQEPLLNEVYEVIEAIDSGNNEHIKEELGDLFFSSLFLMIIAQKEKRCSLEEVIESTISKLVRRHPHVFENQKDISLQDLSIQWEQIKASEKGKSAGIDTIPKKIGALARAQKLVHKLKRAKTIEISDNTISEEEFITKILDLVVLAEKSGFTAEASLHKAFAKLPDLLKDKQVQ